jgi:DNA-binding transcriptional MocR family regulator
MIDTGSLQSHVEQVRARLGARSVVLQQAVQTHFKGRARCFPASGGYFHYVHVVDAGCEGAEGALPAGFSVAGLRAFCDEVGAGVAFMSCDRCRVSGAVREGEEGFGKLPVCEMAEVAARLGIRVSVSYFDVPEIESGIERLARAFEQYIASLQAQAS